jgi:hypothetical protein
MGGVLPFTDLFLMLAANRNDAPNRTRRARPASTLRRRAFLSPWPTPRGLPSDGDFNDNLAQEEALSP